MSGGAAGSPSTNSRELLGKDVNFVDLRRRKMWRGRRRYFHPAGDRLIFQKLHMCQACTE
jgi:hypothetical protein